MSKPSACLYCGKTSVQSMEAMRKEILEIIGYKFTNPQWNYPRGPMNRAEIAAIHAYLKGQAVPKPPKPEPPEFKAPVCRGSFALGSHCGHCERCDWERSQRS